MGACPGVGAGHGMLALVAKPWVVLAGVVCVHASSTDEKHPCDQTLQTLWSRSLGWTQGDRIHVRCNFRHPHGYQASLSLPRPSLSARESWLTSGTEWTQKS